ncbi:TolC family protein [Chitinophaga niabensis]|uniref:TolC family protein n=1 Tax=Chitinophaga niabensis TaxID=536979 RepID=UPI0031BAF4D6
MNPKASINILLICLTACTPAAAQSGELSLADCFRIARNKNLAVEQARRSLQARQYQLKAEQSTYFPKVDLLAGYNYLSQPLEVNLQQVKNGIVEGSSQQSVSTANSVYQQITGNPLPQPVQDGIYNTTKGIINTVYPNYNPALSKQQYFTAALGLRQPIYLGGKLATARDIAKAEYESGIVNVELVEKQMDFLLAAAYIRILYFNAVLLSQERIVASMERNERFAISLVNNEIIPPYQRNWATVALTFARSRHENIALEKINAMVELKRLMQLPQDTTLTITDTLHYKQLESILPPEGFYKGNPTYKAVASKTALAESTVKASRSLSLPNIFGIASLNLYQRDLPITTPPWLVGVEMQWNLFSGFSHQKKVKATKLWVDEAKIAADNTQALLEAGAAVVRNKVTVLQRDMQSLSQARAQAQLTTAQVQERLANQLSSVKDVNDALLIEEEIGKAYYTALFGYLLAAAEYYNILGTPQQITTLLQ